MGCLHSLQLHPLGSCWGGGGGGVSCLVWEPPMARGLCAAPSLGSGHQPHIKKLKAWPGPGTGPSQVQGWGGWLTMVIMGET